MKQFWSKSLACLLCLALLVGMLPVAALAEEPSELVSAVLESPEVSTTDGSSENNAIPLADGTGDFTVAGGTQENYSYADGVLTIHSGTLTVSGSSTTDRIVVDGNANLTLDGVSITFNDGMAGSGDTTESNAGTCALSLGANTTLNLTLAGENTLQSGAGRAGIFVPQGSTLNVSGTGTLNVMGGRLAAGIGGDLWHNAGTINIENGIINATGGSDAAAIGGGHANDGEGLGQPYGGFTRISITGGTVNAETTGNSSAIGTGCWWKEGSCSISISNAIVTASTTGDHQDCAAIGRGISSGSNTVSVTITDSIVTATNAAGKGDSISSGGSSGVNISNSIVSVSTGSDHTGNPTLSGIYTVLENQFLNIPAGSTLTLADGAVLTNNGVIVNRGTISGSGKISNEGTICNADEGSLGQSITLEGKDPENLGSIKYLDADGNEKTAGEVTLLTSDTASWSDGWYMVPNSVNISSRVTVTGDVHLILADDCSLNATRGINVSGTNSLTIYAQSAGEGMGKLTANGERYQAGIGGGNFETCGTITINGGIICATALEDYTSGTAGIGCGWQGQGGTIIINGGKVVATSSGYYSGAGIGGCRGWDYPVLGPDITINGGEVTATGGNYSAGIGGGWHAVGGTITINGGTVTAFGGYRGAGIGGGSSGAGGDKIEINGGTITATGGLNGGNALGGGYNGSGGIITVNGGTILAKAHDDNIGLGISQNTKFVSDRDSSAIIMAESIGNGIDLSEFNGIIKQGSTYTVYGSTNLTTNLEIQSGETMQIDAGKTLTIPEGVTLTNNSTLTNNGTIICYGTITGTVGGDVRYPSSVTVSLTQGGQSVTSVSYGSTITITATMTKQTATNALTATEGMVDFWLGDVDTDTKLGSANVTATDSTYTATLTLNDEMWAKGFAIGSNTITADFGGVAGGSGTGLVSGTGTATLTVTKGSQTAPGAPTMSDRTTTSVTLDTISGGQGTVQYGYTTDGNTSDYHWQTDTTFNNHTRSRVSTHRYAGNDYYNESQTSTGTSVTTLPAITTTSLAAGYVGVSYSATLHASAAKDKAVTWALVSSGSTLPGGLRLDNNTITGTPNAAAPNHSFTVQATINGADSTQTVTNTAYSVHHHQSGHAGFQHYQRFRHLYLRRHHHGPPAPLTPSSQVPSNGINSIAEPAQNQVGLYVTGNDSPIATAIVIDDSFVLSYDTAGKGIPIGENQALTVRYGGSSTLTNGSTTVEITLNHKAVTAQVQGEITKVYDGNTSATVNLAVASNDLVNGNDEITVTGTGTYNSADAGTNIPVTVSDIQATGAGSAWYTVSAPTGVTGAITQATQEAPDAPTVIERTSSSVTLAALATIGQGALSTATQPTSRLSLTIGKLSPLSRA